MSLLRPLSRLLALLAPLLLAISCAAAPVAPAPATAEPSATALASAYPGIKVVPTDAPAPLPSVAVPALGAPVQSFRVVASYPHDAEAYTQGLIYRADGAFYESTGLYERSSLREVDLASGELRRSVLLNDLEPPRANGALHFGEGIAVFGERIFQLTWQSGFGLVYDRASLAVQGRFSYPPPGRDLPVEGWGLTDDGTQLIMSDGTANLYFVDPEETVAAGALAVTGQITVHDQRGPVINLNELEYIDGEVYANIWQSDLIARIDPASGTVLAYLDLSELRALLPPGGQPEVLNGIAYDATGERLFVTGKLWPLLFEIQLEPLLSHSLYLPYVGMG